MHLCRHRSAPAVAAAPAAGRWCLATAGQAQMPPPFTPKTRRWGQFHTPPRVKGHATWDPPSVRARMRCGPRPQGHPYMAWWRPWIHLWYGPAAPGVAVLHPHNHAGCHPDRVPLHLSASRTCDSLRHHHHHGLAPVGRCGARARRIADGSHAAGGRAGGEAGHRRVGPRARGGGRDEPRSGRGRCVGSVCATPGGVSGG